MWLVASVSAHQPTSTYKNVMKKEQILQMISIYRRTLTDTCAQAHYMFYSSYVHSFPDWADQLPGPRSDVSVLQPGSFGTEHA